MAGMLNNMANLANVKLTAALTATGTSVTVDDASPFQNLGDFYATLMPAGEMSRLSNSEIVLCSYATATTLAISRAQRGTTARAFNAGDILTNGIYVEDLEQVQSVGNTTFATTFSNNVYTISSNNDMLPALPTDGMRITILAGGTSTGLATLALQSGITAYNILTGSAINNGSIAHNIAKLESGEQYELVFDGNSDCWLVNNLVSEEGLTSYLLNKIYPVGSIYMSTNNVSPATFIGGTWAQIQNTFLLAAGSNYAAGSTGGEATHTLTINEMPKHRHSYNDYWNTAAGGSSVTRHAVAFEDIGAKNGGGTNSTGGDQAHNNMPPYLAVYMWKRTA